MFKKIILGAALAWQAGAITAQQLETPEELIPDLSVKFSPGHLISFYPSIQLAVEKKIAPKTTGQLELGYVYRTGDPSGFMNKHGYKAKAEAHYYLQGNVKRRSIPYLAIEVYRNAVDSQKERKLYGCLDEDCQHSYSRQMVNTIEYREHGMNVKYGIMAYVENFFFDFNFGAGLRSIRYHEPALPAGTHDYGEYEFFDIPNESDRDVIGPVLGIRIGYRIK